MFEKTISNVVASGFVVSFRDGKGRLINVDLEKSATRSEREQVMGALQRIVERIEPESGHQRKPGEPVIVSDEAELFRSWAYR